MEVIKRIKINVDCIQDTIVLYSPSSASEFEDMFRFRYDSYLRHEYILPNVREMDVDYYDKDKSFVEYINAWSQHRKSIVGSVRIIMCDPLPITKDCFNFKSPLFIKLFSRGRLLEVGRLVIEPYGPDIFLPRHLILFLLMKEITLFAKREKIRFAYAFVKKKFYSKLRKIYFPFFRIRKYEQKYSEGVLKPYFNQPSDPVYPVYFNYLLIRVYLFFVSLRFKRHLDVIN